MLCALLPDDVRPENSVLEVFSVGYDGVDPDIDLERIGFYVPPYLGPQANLELIARMPNLQIVQLLTAGYEAALPYLPTGVTLCNAAGVHDASTAEMALALILASLRGLDDFARAMQSGEWLHGRRESLADKRIVVVGAGGVGHAIAARLAPFETHTVLVGRTARDGVVAGASLPDLLPISDIVVLAVPLSDETASMVNDEFLASMRDGALLVNVSRGGVVDTDALLSHLITGRIRAALDVTDPEPLPADHQLWRTPGVLISPHVGGNSSAFLPRARRLVARQLKRWADGEPLEHVIPILN